MPPPHETSRLRSLWSGNFAGVDTILVKPQATQDLWYTQIFRIFERRALRDLPCEE